MVPWKIEFLVIKEFQNRNDIITQLSCLACSTPGIIKIPGKAPIYMLI